MNIELTAAFIPPEIVNARTGMIVNTDEARFLGILTGLRVDKDSVQATCVTGRTYGHSQLSYVTKKSPMFRAHGLPAYGKIGMLGVVAPVELPFGAVNIFGFPGPLRREKTIARSDLVLDAVARHMAFACTTLETNPLEELHIVEPMIPKEFRPVIQWPPNHAPLHYTVPIPNIY